MSIYASIDLDQRPFAIDPNTGMIFPDGIFIKSFNRGKAIMRMKINHIKTFPIGSGGWIIEARRGRVNYIVNKIESTELSFSYLGPRIVRTRLENNCFWLDFEVDLSQASVNKHKIKITLGRYLIDEPYMDEIEYSGLIYVADVTMKEHSLTSIVKFPELTFYSKPIKHRYLRRSQQSQLKSTIVLPVSFTTSVEYHKTFSGEHGPLPFNDPLLKVACLAGGLFLLAVAGVWYIAGEIGLVDDVADIEGEIGDVSEEPVDDEEGEECTNCQTVADVTVTPKDPMWLFVFGAGILGLMGAAFLGDVRDPFRIGEKKSIPTHGDRTVSESLNYSYIFKHFPLPGTPFKGNIDWKYTRHVERETDYDPVGDMQNIENIHWTDQYLVYTEDNQSEYILAETQELVVIVNLKPIDQVRFLREVEKGLRGKTPEFYIFGCMRHKRSNRTKWQRFEPKSELFFEGSFEMTADDPTGEWGVMVFVQNINNADPADTPEEQSEIVGGILYSRNFSLVRDAGGKGCTIKQKWDLELVFS